METLQKQIYCMKINTDLLPNDQPWTTLHVILWRIAIPSGWELSGYNTESLDSYHSECRVYRVRHYLHVYDHFYRFRKGYAHWFRLKRAMWYILLVPWFHDGYTMMTYNMVILKGIPGKCPYFTIVCCFLCLRLVVYIFSFSGLSIFDCSFGIL